MTTLTVKNYPELTKGVDFSKAPDHVKEAHKDFADYAEFYNDDKDIKQMLDNHIEIVSKMLKKEPQKHTVPVENARRPHFTDLPYNHPLNILDVDSPQYKEAYEEMFGKPKVADKAKKSTKTAQTSRKTVQKSVKSKQTTTKTKSSKTKNTKTDCINPAKKVEIYPEDVRLIRRFFAAIGKERQRRSILAIYRDMERRKTERKVNSQSQHAGLIKEISAKLKKALDAMSKNGLTHITIEVDKDFYKKVEQASRALEIRATANLLKRFIGIEGEEKPDKEKVKRILASFESSVKRGKVCESDLYWKEFNAARAEMQKYIKGESKVIALSPQQLNGLQEVCGLGKPKAVQNHGLVGTAESKESIVFNKQIINAKRNGFASTTVFKLGLTKNKLKEIVGNGEMFMSGKVLKKIMTKDNDHNLLWHNLINLPDSINNPSAIFKSTSTGFVVLTEIIDYRNKPVIAAIHVNELSQIIDIKSMYVKSNNAVYRKWVKDGLLLYNNEKSDQVKRVIAPIATSTPKSLKQNKNTKKNNNTKLSGVENQQPTEIIERFEIDLPNHNVGLSSGVPTPSQKLTIEPEKPKESAKQPKNSLFTPITEVRATAEKLSLPGDLGKFLGYVERNEYSIVLRGDKGAGKSRMTYQMMNTFALAGFTCGCFSLEIGKDSHIVEDMKNSYLHPTIAHKVQIAETCSGIQDVEEAAKMFDVVVIDSWGKIPGVKPEHLDMLRKKYKNTMFVFIFQSTTNGTARGGSSSEYDAGMVIQIDTGGIAYCEKNRYNGENYKYLVFEQRLATDEDFQKAS